MATKRTMDKTDPPSRNPKLQTERMMTRHKSNQMKRKLRDKDRSMTRITQLLRSPPKNKPTNPTKLSPTSKLSAYLAKTALGFSKSPSKQHVTYSSKASNGSMTNKKSLLIKTTKKSNISNSSMRINKESASPDYVKAYPGKSFLKSNNIQQETNLNGEKVLESVAMTRNVSTNTSKSFTVTRPPKKAMPKIVSVNSKHVQKDAENNNTEYYPDKLRRTGNVKKIVLKPKNEWKVIGGLNKRKRYYPLKDSKMPNKQPKLNSTPPCSDIPIEPSADVPDLTVEELIQLREETDSLTDDDLMEILTCPSPVWWESQEDCEFFEDPIIKVSETRDNAAAKSDSTLVQEIAVDKCDDKFLKKKSSLENVLLFIKTKVLIDNQTEVAEKINNKDKIDAKSSKKNLRKAGRFKSPVRKSAEENALIILESMHIPVESSGKTSKVVTNDDPIILDEDSDSESGENKHKSNKEFDKKEKDVTGENGKEINEKISEMDISTTLPPLKYFPKAVDSPKSSLDISEADDVIDSTSIISSQGMSDTISDTNVRFMEELSSNESDIHEKQVTVVNQVKQIETAKKVKEDLRRMYLKLTQKESEKIDAADKLVDQQPANDSDKIICERYIRTDEISQLPQDEEYVVVYKIIDNANNVTLEARNNVDFNKESCSKDLAVAKPDTENNQKHIIPQTKIDEFNKKVKNATKKEKPTNKSTMKKRNASSLKINKMSDQKIQNGVKTNEKENKTNFCKSCIDKTKISIRISNNEIIHYCSKCSSIFETSQCMFCLRKSSVESDSTKFTCKLCNTRCCCDINLKAHLKKHISMSSQDS